jgi:hypothetical protein
MSRGSRVQPTLLARRTIRSHFSEVTRIPERPRTDYTMRYSTARLKYSISGQPAGKCQRWKQALRTVDRFRTLSSRSHRLIESRASIDVPREALLNEGRDRGATERGSQDDLGNLNAGWIA